MYILKLTTILKTNHVSLVILDILDINIITSKIRYISYDKLTYKIIRKIIKVPDFPNKKKIFSK